MVKKSFIRAYLYICIKNIVLESVEQIKINVSSLKYSLGDKSPKISLVLIKFKFSVSYLACSTVILCQCNVLFSKGFSMQLSV